MSLFIHGLTYIGVVVGRAKLFPLNYSLLEIFLKNKILGLKIPVLGDLWAKLNF